MSGCEECDDMTLGEIYPSLYEANTTRFPLHLFSMVGEHFADGEVTVAENESRFPV